MRDDVEVDEVEAVPALPNDVLAGPGTDLWCRVLRRQGMPLALLASYPADLVLN